MKSKIIFPVAILLCFGLIASQTAGADSSLWGSAAARADLAPGFESMMTYAIQDEYTARAEYAVIMGKYGTMTPFSNIIRAEENHISWLREAYAAYRLPVPQDNSASFTAVPTTLKGAFEAGVQAEIDNIAMYDGFLANPIIGKPENATLRELFTRLRDASKNHLRAFRNGLSRF